MSATLADPSHDGYVLMWGGSHFMMNSNIDCSLFNGYKLIVMVCDNGGFAVINLLQNFMGGTPFNNFIHDSHIAVDFTAHAWKMGAEAAGLAPDVGPLGPRKSRLVYLRAGMPALRRWPAHGAFWPIELWGRT